MPLRLGGGHPDTSSRLDGATRRHDHKAVTKSRRGGKNPRNTQLEVPGARRCRRLGHPGRIGRVQHRAHDRDAHRRFHLASDGLSRRPFPPFFLERVVKPCQGRNTASGWGLVDLPLTADSGRFAGVKPPVDLSSLSNTQPPTGVGPARQKGVYGRQLAHSPPFCSSRRIAVCHMDSAVVESACGTGERETSGRLSRFMALSRGRCLFLTPPIMPNSGANPIPPMGIRMRR